MSFEMRKIIFVPIFAFAAFIATYANADVVISYGVNEGGTNFVDLLADTPNQAIQLFGTGIVADGGADGFELDVQIGDGGATFGGTDAPPFIESIDLITGTIWSSDPDNAPNQTDVVTDPNARQSIVDIGALIMADGLLGTIFIDTRGFGEGEIDFILTGVGGQFDTVLFQGSNQLETTAPNGRLRIEAAIPEPSSAFVVLSCLVGLGFRRNRN